MPDKGDDTPDATRAVFRLRTPLVVPAGWPPDVSPNQIITASHINAIKSSVYAWPGDVDGQNHTLSNVHLVNATGVLADPTTTAGDLIARDAAAIGRLAIGAAGQVLTVDLALPNKLKWATPAAAPVLSFNTRTGAVMPAAGDYTAAMITGALADPLTTKGDLIARGAVTGRMPVGTDGQVLRADSASAPFGIRWAGESVPSVFGRSGAPIVAQAGDYSASQVTNAVSVLGSYPDPVWISSFSYGKLIGTPASFPPAAHTHDAAAIVSGVLATARLGTGVADATVYLRGDGTWAAAGTGGGGGVISVFGRAGNVIAQSGDYTAAMVGAIPANLLTSTGDLLVRNNVNALTRLPIGANGQVLQTDLATSVGMKWTSISASVQTPWVTNEDAAGFDLFNLHRLGVALTVPNYAVDVVGDINYTGVLRSNGVPVVFGGSQTPWTQNINASGFSLNNAGTVGIGVAAPQAAPIQVATHTPGIAGSLAVQDLDATTAGNPVLLVTGLGSEGSRCWAVGNRGGATYGKDLYVWNDRASALLFGTNSAERMRITAAGLVGIGRTPATYPLEVQGDVSVTGAYRINGVPIATSQTPWTQDIDGAGFKLTNVSNIAIASGISDVQLVVGNTTVDTYKLGRATATGYLNFVGSQASPYAGYIFSINGGSNELMRITSAGNVGIGTTSPQVALDVRGGVDLSNTARIWRDGHDNYYKLTTTDGTTLQLSYSGNPTPIMTATYNGNVGIGTTSPQSRLHVKQIAGDGYSAGIQVERFGTTNTAAFYIGGDNQAYIQAGAAGYLTVQTGGNVGISNAGPAYRLDVAGDVNCSGVFRINGAQVPYPVNAASGQGLYDLGGQADVPGLTMTVPYAGRYLVFASLYFTGDGNTFNVGRIFLLANGAQQASVADYGPGSGTGSQGAITFHWIVVVPGGSIIKLQAAKLGGSSVKLAPNLSSFSALWVMPS